MFENFNGITIKELKNYVKGLPEINPVTDESYEVWIGTRDNRSNQCKRIIKLNRGDVILEIQ